MPIPYRQVVAKLQSKSDGEAERCTTDILRAITIPAGPIEPLMTLRRPRPPTAARLVQRFAVPDFEPELVR
jgi:hypothetical protein